MGRLSVEITDEQHKALKVKAASQGITVKELVTSSITVYLRDNP